MRHPGLPAGFRVAAVGYKRTHRSIFCDYSIGSLLLRKGKDENFDALLCEPIYGFEGRRERTHIVLDGQHASRPCTTHSWPPTYGSPTATIASSTSSRWTASWRRHLMTHSSTTGLATDSAFSSGVTRNPERERADRAQGLHRVLRQGDRRHVRRRPPPIHGLHAGRQPDTGKGHRKGGPKRLGSVYRQKW